MHLVASSAAAARPNPCSYETTTDVCWTQPFCHTPGGWSRPSLTILLTLVLTMWSVKARLRSERLRMNVGILYFFDALQQLRLPAFTSAKAACKSSAIQPGPRVPSSRSCRLCLHVVGREVGSVNVVHLDGGDWDSRSGLEMARTPCDAASSFSGHRHHWRLHTLAGRTDDQQTWAGRRCTQSGSCQTCVHSGRWTSRGACSCRIVEGKSCPSSFLNLQTQWNTRYLPL